MKKLLFTITLALATIVATAQGTIVTKYFNELATNDAFTKVSVNSKMFSLFTELTPGSEAEKEFLAAVSKLKGLKIITADSIGDSKKMYSRALTDITGAAYEELMSVQDKGENMRFFIKEKSGIIEELLMLVGGNKQFVLLSLYGEIDLKNISKIAQAMRVEGLDQLSKMNDGKGN